MKQLGNLAIVCANRPDKARSLGVAVLSPAEFFRMAGE